jgi:hypothetical protein
MLFKREELNQKKLESNHQKEVANIFKSAKEKTIKANIHNELEKERGIPKNAVGCFEESYIIKKGKIVTTGVDIYIAHKDALTIKSQEDRQKIEEEVERVSKAIGYAGFSRQINNIIDWAAKEHYENEKDSNGDLAVSVDFWSILNGKNEIKIGQNKYVMPNELLDN